MPIKPVLFILGIVVLCLFCGCGKKAPTAGGQYHIEQDGNVFGAGAEKIILSLHADKTFDVKAGPLTMLRGTWSTKDNMLTFSAGQGSIVVSYRIEEKTLIPIKEGQELKNWRWKQ